MLVQCHLTAAEPVRLVAPLSATYSRRESLSQYVRVTGVVIKHHRQGNNASSLSLSLFLCLCVCVRLDILGVSSLFAELSAKLALQVRYLTLSPITD